MESLIRLLLLLTQKAQFNSETDRDDALELLRKAAEELGAADVVPPPAGDMNPPTETPAVDPGVVAEPVPAEEQPPPPTSPEVSGAAPEESNAFSGTSEPGA